MHWRNDDLSGERGKMKKYALATAGSIALLLCLLTLGPDLVAADPQTGAACQAASKPQSTP